MSESPKYKMQAGSRRWKRFKAAPKNKHGFPILARKNTAEVSDRMKARVKREQNYFCVDCDLRKRLTIHHIKPRAQGGSNSRKNLIGLCGDCHKQRHRSTPMTSADVAARSERLQAEALESLRRRLKED